MIVKSPSEPPTKAIEYRVVASNGGNEEGFGSKRKAGFIEIAIVGATD